MPGWVFAGSIRVRGGLGLLMACTDTLCHCSALTVPASRPEKSHPGVTAGACFGDDLNYPYPYPYPYPSPSLNCSATTVARAQPMSLNAIPANTVNPSQWLSLKA